MTDYTFDISITHSIVVENTDEDRNYTTTCELVDIGPLNGPDIKHFESINFESINFDQGQNCQCIQ